MEQFKHAHTPNVQTNIWKENVNVQTPRLNFVWNNVIEKNKFDWNAELEIKFLYSKKVMSFLSMYVYIQFDYLSMKQM